MKNDIKFSIIIPAYNSEKYLENCLDSVVSQTFKNFEIIIVNDGSTDNTQEIIDKYIKENRFISCIRQKNSGLSASRNNGLDKAKGEYIVYLDSDDSINLDFLENINCALEKERKNQIDVIRVNVNTINNNNESSCLFDKMKVLNGEDLLMYLISNKVMVVPAWAYVYRREFLLENNYIFEIGRYHEDYGLTIKVLLSSKTDLIVPTSIYNYYIRSNSIMTSKDREKNSKKAMDMLYFYDNMLLFLNDKVKDETKCLMVKSYLTNGLINNINNLNDDFKKIFIDELKKRKIENNLLNNTFSRKCKKIICSINYKFYAKIFNK